MRKAAFLPFIYFSIFAAFLFFGPAAHASFLDTIGVTLLRLTTTNLDGTGVRVAQAEADLNNGTPPLTFEVNPANPGVALPVSDFTYYTIDGSSTMFTNSLGVESGHGDNVGATFYGAPGGVSTNVAHIDNYEAAYFAFTVVPGLIAANGDRVVNQSFDITGGDQLMFDLQNDLYAAQFQMLIVTSAGNGGTVLPPSTCYNGLSVAAFNGASSVGPTADNGRAKPDITAPADVTSYSAPQVAGAATLLFQAASRGDAGADTNSAGDIRTIKALLLNGAIKPDGWAAPSPSPLDPRYGAGVLNVFESYNQMIGGKQAFIDSSSVPTGTPHPPTSAPGNISVMSGWDFNTVSSTTNTDGIQHYYFNLTNSVDAGPFTATVTLVWDRQTNNINNLDLFLYDTVSGNLIAASTSQVDNVEHIYIPALPPGRYDLQVLKNGVSTVSPEETYALAFEFFTVPLNISLSGSNAVLTWPLYPAGFVLQSTPTLDPTSWSLLSVTSIVTNGQNSATVDASSGNQFFRLVRP